MIILIISGVILSISNFFNKKIDAMGALSGTIDPESGECLGAPLNCGIAFSSYDTGSDDLAPSKNINLKEPQNIQKTKMVELDINPEKIQFSTKFESPINTLGFCVTEDELFIIPDYTAGNIKIYEKVGEFLGLVRIIGQKGYGHTEFAKPSFCFYNKIESKFGIMDFGTRKISIYDRIGRTAFGKIQEVHCWRGASDFQLLGNKLLISGYALDQNGAPYDLYYIDLNNDKRNFLLPSYYKYGLKSFKEYKSKYKESEIPSIGIRGWLDVYGDDVYFAWEGDLRIIKLNIKTRDLIFFGKKTSHYVKPFASEKLIKGHRVGDINLTLGERAKMSYIRNIFAIPKYVLVIYEGPVKKDKETNFRLQLYSLNGDFLKDLPIPGKPDHKMWFDKEKKILYSLSTGKPTEQPRYSILKYKIKLLTKNN